MFTLEQFKNIKTSAMLFETKECARCNGSGRYSWCQQWGDTCFKCGGSGRLYTKRGAKAKAAYKALHQKTATDVQVGDFIVDRSPMGTQKFTVAKITHEPGYTTFHSAKGWKYTTYDACKITVLPESWETKYQWYLQALEAK